MSRRSIPIHIWGGLGSQLYGLALGIYLRKRSRFLDYFFIFHTSGVTRRTPDIDTLSRFGIYQKSIDDFNPASHFPSADLARHGFVLRLLKFLLKITSVQVSCNSDAQTRKIKYWTKEVRGHYSYRSVSEDIIHEIYAGLYPENCKFDFTDADLAVHYRLGDLIGLQSKDPIDCSLLIHAINQTLENNNVSKIVVFSDSPEMASELILKGQYSTSPINFSFPKIDIYSTINILTRSNIFLATPSKVSEWVLLFRKSENRSGLNIVPKSFHNFKIKYDLDIEFEY